MIINLNDCPSIMTKIKAQFVADKNNREAARDGEPERYEVREFNALQKAFVVDVVENGAVVFTL